MPRDDAASCDVPSSAHLLSYSDAPICVSMRVDGSKIPVEEALDEFVPRIGGVRVDSILGNATHSPNADYVFREDNVIAELKCLEKDLNRDRDAIKKVTQICERWVRQGLIPPIPPGVRTIDTAGMPTQCQRELADFFGKRVRKVVRKANDQIKNTKKDLDMPDAFGLLLLVNDGGFHIPLEAFPYYLSHALRPRWDKDGTPRQVQNTSIDQVIFFTMNMPMRTGSVPEETEPWAPMYRDKRQIPRVFLNRFRDGWFNFLADKSGVPMKVYMNVDHDSISEMKYTEEGRSPVPRDLK